MLKVKSPVALLAKVSAATALVVALPPLIWFFMVWGFFELMSMERR